MINISLATSFTSFLKHSSCSNQELISKNGHYFFFPPVDGSVGSLSLLLLRVQRGYNWVLIRWNSLQGAERVDCWFWAILDVKDVYYSIFPAFLSLVLMSPRVRIRPQIGPPKNQAGDQVTRPGPLIYLLCCKYSINCGVQTCFIGVGGLLLYESADKWNWMEFAHHIGGVKGRNWRSTPDGRGNGCCECAGWCDLWTAGMEVVVGLVSKLALAVVLQTAGKHSTMW